MSQKKIYKKKKKTHSYFWIEALFSDESKEVSSVRDSGLGSKVSVPEIISDSI